MLAETGLLAEAHLDSELRVQQRSVPKMLAFTQRIGMHRRAKTQRLKNVLEGEGPVRFEL